MGNQFNNAELRKIHAETQNKTDFGNASVNHEFTWNVLDLQTLESNPFRTDDLILLPKPDMYSMPAIFNFHHLKVEDHHHQQQHHQIQLPIQLQQNNGMFLKKEVQVQASSQMQIPTPTSTQSQSSSGSGSRVGQTDEGLILEHHMKVNKANQKPYQCNYCAKSYKQLLGMKNHIKTHLGEGVQPCTFCGKNFPWPDSAQAQSRSTESKPFICKSCSNKHQQQQVHQLQQQLQHPQQIQIHLPSSSFQIKSSPQPQPQVQGRADMEEESCPESEKQYACQFCKKRFQHPSTLKMHLTTHVDDKPFVCQHCNKNFKRSSSLKIHERTHTGEKTHECSYCGKLFAYEVFLKVHLRKHTGEKPYCCKLCDKTFTQQGNLKSHIKRKHAGSEDILNILT